MSQNYFQGLFWASSLSLFINFKMYYNTVDGHITLVLRRCLFISFLERLATDPEVCHDVDLHRLLDQRVRAVEELATGHDAGVVDQNVDVADLRLHLVINVNSLEQEFKATNRKPA